jgi:hypothetical protein
LWQRERSIQKKIRNRRTSTVSLPRRDQEVAGFCRDLVRAIDQRDGDAAERIAPHQSPAHAGASAQDDARQPSGQRLGQSCSPIVWA